MKRPKTICVIQEYCDICGKERTLPAMTLDGVAYCARKECSKLAYRKMDKDRAQRLILEQPFV